MLDSFRHRVLSGPGSCCLEQEAEWESLGKERAGREASPPPTFLRYPHYRQSQWSQIKAQQGPEEAFPQRLLRGLSLSSLHTPGPFKLFNASKWVGGASALLATPRHIHLFKRKKKHTHAHTHNPHTLCSRIFCQSAVSSVVPTVSERRGA